MQAMRAQARDVAIAEVHQADAALVHRNAVKNELQFHAAVL